MENSAHTVEKIRHFQYKQLSSLWEDTRLLQPTDGKERQNNMAGHNNGNKSAVMSTNPVLSPVCLLPLRTFSLFYCLRMCCRQKGAWISETFSTCADEHTLREKFWVRCTKWVTSTHFTISYQQSTLVEVRERNQVLVAWTWTKTELRIRKWPRDSSGSFRKSLTNNRYLYVGTRTCFSIHLF